MSSLSLKRNFSWTILGNLVYAGSQWGILVVLTKLGSPEMVGQFTLGLAVTAPVFMLTNLQLRQIEATDADRRYEFRDYLGLRLLCSQLAVGVIVLIACVSHYRWETLGVVILMGIAKGLESISDVCYGLFQKHERMDRIALSLMMKGPLTLLFLLIGVWLSGSVLGGVLGLILAWSMILTGYDLVNSRWLLEVEPLKIGEDLTREQSSIRSDGFQPNWNWTKLRAITVLALPLGIVMMLSSLSSNLPNYFIVAHLGEDELGIFNAIAYLMIAGNIIVGALGDSASPRLAKYYAAGDHRAYSLLLFQLTGIGLILGVIAVTVASISGETLLTLLYSPIYAERKPLFILLMAGSGIQYIASFLGYGLTAARYFRIQVPLLLSKSAVLTVACFWLVPQMGLTGGAIALILSSSVHLCIALGIVFHAILAQNVRTEAS